MAETKITNIIIPEVFAPYIAERSLNQSKFFQSGILVNSPQLSALLAGGGKTFNLPYWQDLTGDTDVPSETVDITVNNIDTEKMVARRQIREKAWGSNTLASAFAGANAFDAIGDRVAGFWAKAKDSALIYTARGIIADNIANDSGDLVVDISTEDGDAATSANKISAKKTIEGVMKQGDHFDELIGIAVRSEVYKTLLENDLIDFEKDSEGKLTIAMYMGLKVIISDNLPAIAGGSSGYKYHSYLFKPGAFAYGRNMGPFLPVELDRDKKKGGGIDILITREQYGIHPLGFSWVMASDTGITPTDANLYDAASWDRVYDKKNTGIVCIISNG